MRQLKRSIPAFFLFILLLVCEFVFMYLNHKHSFEDYDRCMERKNGEFCSDVQSARDAAFSSATSNRILTYLVIFLTFTLMDLKLSKTEERLEKLEARIDV